MTSRKYRVSEKQKNNEENVKRTLYNKLYTADIEHYGEYNIGKSRCDIVIVQDDYVVCAIEVKRRPREIRNNTRQIKKYKKLAIPVVYCCGFNNVEPTVDFIENQILNDLEDIPPGIYKFNSKH